MTKSLRWGILGTGNIAAKFADQLNQASHGELVACGSRQQSSADQFSQQYGGKGYGSYEELVSDPQVEAIYVSLPNSLHAPWSIAGLEAGKHVLCEKPLAASTAEVEQMFATADATGMKLMEAFMYRQHPVVKEVLNELQGGIVGNIKIIRSHFTYQRPDSSEDIRYQPELGGGGLLDVGCYCINFMRAIAGAEPERMHIQTHQHPTGVDDVAVGAEVETFLIELDDDRLAGRELLDQAAEGTVEQQLTVVDDDDPFTQGLDVGHVMARQQHSGIVELVVGADEAADTTLHRDIQTERGLIEEEDARTVQQRCRHFTLHALSQGEIAHRFLQKAVEVE